MCFFLKYVLAARIRSDAERAMRGVIDSIVVPQSTRLELLSKLQSVTLEASDHQQSTIQMFIRNLTLARKELKNQLKEQEQEQSQFQKTLAAAEERLKTVDSLENELRQMTVNYLTTEETLKSTTEKLLTADKNVFELETREKFNQATIEKLQRQQEKTNTNQSKETEIM